MIGIQVKGINFRGILSYHNKKIDEGVAKILETNLSGRDVKELTKEFNLVSQLRPGLKKTVYHVSLSLPPNEKLKDLEFLELSKEYLTKMGFNDNQYVIYKHSDREHEHVHCVVNRVKLSGEVVSDSNDFKRSESLIRTLENEYNLCLVTSSYESKKAALTKNEIEMSLRTGSVAKKIQIQNSVDQFLKEKIEINEFIDGLNRFKIEVKFNISKTTNRISGISFSNAGISFKGSSLGKKYSWNSLKKVIQYEQDRHSQIIRNNNARIADNKEFIGRKSEKDQTDRIEKNIEERRANFGIAKVDSYNSIQYNRSIKR